MVLKDSALPMASPMWAHGYKGSAGIVLQAIKALILCIPQRDSNPHTAPEPTLDLGLTLPRSRTFTVGVYLGF